MGPVTKNGCAGEDQQQSTGLHCTTAETPRLIFYATHKTGLNDLKANKNIYPIRMLPFLG
jgi:hypothetical protein